MELLRVLLLINHMIMSVYVFLHGIKWQVKNFTYKMWKLKRQFFYYTVKSKKHKKSWVKGANKK